MRKILAVAFLAVAPLSLHADEHLDHLRMMVRAMSQHGPVVPQPTSVVGLNTVTINIKAQQFFFTPSTFSVNQGDVVTLVVSVPANDGSPVGHGVLMETYVPDGLNVPTGKTESVTFTATTAGTFAWVCTQPSCGVGHSNMFGQMVVNAAPSGPTITSISPATASTAGGTPIVISGSGFQSGATVTIGGIAAGNISVVSSTTIDAMTPIGPATEEAGVPVDVKVVNPDGTSATDPQAFTWSVPPLALTEVTPDVGLTSGGTVILTGAGFTTAVTSSVTFGGVPATNLQVINAITIEVTAPPHAAGTVDVVLTVGGSTVTRPHAFTFATALPRHRAVSH